MLDSASLKVAHAQLTDIVAGLRGVEPEKSDPKVSSSPAKPVKQLKTVVSKGAVSLNSFHYDALKQMSGKEPKSLVLVGGDQGHPNGVYEINAEELHTIVTGFKPASA